jgi:hypothetical protein
LGEAIRPVPAGVLFWYAGRVKSSVSIVLFFLLSGFFLAALLAALEHSRKLLAVAGGCLAAVVCIIVFLTPVEFPSWHLGRSDDRDDATVRSTVSLITSTTSTVPVTTSTTLDTITTAEASGVQSP